MEIGPGMPPMELSSQMPPPKGFKPNPDKLKKSFYLELLDNLLIAILVVAASTSFKLFSRWLNEERKNEELENERLKSELALLRNQVSPHFLMNTLNNIYALIAVDTDRAMDAVIRLSTLMRYLLYDTNAGTTSLIKEVGFIESYFSLMKLRYTKDIDLKLELPDNIPEIAIPPMLFISFLENAFKHGVSYQKKSFVLFHIDIDGSRLNCTIRNSVHSNKEKPCDHYSGIGLVNVKKSLDLLYPKSYTLNIDNKDNEFTVSLSIPI
jgi:LytS/YehU family sensor histidine kinase